MEDCDKVSLDSFIDDFIQNNKHYYSFTNVTRSYSSAKEDSLSKSRILDF